MSQRLAVVTGAARGIDALSCWNSVRPKVAGLDLNAEQLAELEKVVKVWAQRLDRYVDTLQIPQN